MSSAFIQAAVILLREGLEAMLVIAALAGYLTRAGADHRVGALYGGALAAVGASIVAAWLFAGLAAGAIALAVLFYFINLIARKLPLRPLFIITSAFLFAMAIKFIGEAVQEFQESAVLPFTELKGAGFLGAIGLNPTVEALSAQVLVIVFALATWSVVSRNARLARQDKAMRAAKS